MPTLRQKKAFNKVLENGGNVSKAMIESDYSPAMAKNPHKLTQSKGFQELMDEAGLTDDLLLERHLELLNKKEVIVVHQGKESHTEVTNQPDTQAVKAALDMAYKLKGSYAAEKSVSLNLTADAKDLANPKLAQVKERFEEELRKQLEKSDA